MGCVVKAMAVRISAHIAILHDTESDTSHNQPTMFALHDVSDLFAVPQMENLCRRVKSS